MADDGTILAGHIAFTTLLTLFPFLIFLTTLASQMGQSEAANEFIAFALSHVPPEVADAIRPAIDEVVAQRRTGLMQLSILATLWVASSGIEAVREALNKAYGIAEPRPFWLRRLQSLLLTIVFSASILIVMLALVVAPLIWAYFESLVQVPELWTLMYDVMRYLVGVGLFYFVVVLMYQVLPNRRLRRREVLPGAAVTVLLWLILAKLFSFYLQNLARYSITYGSLGGIVLTLLFFYVSAAIFIFGAEINSARRRAEAARLHAQRARRREATSGESPQP